jgi:hypothetical protein
MMDAVTGAGELTRSRAGGERARPGVRLTGRDIDALVWCGEMYGVRADLLASLLGVSGDVVRQLHVRWRRAGLAETAKLGSDPVWCWLTRAGLETCGLSYGLYQPPLGRLGHVHAVGTVRAALEAWEPYRQGGAYWRSERRLRWRLGSSAGRRGHVPDGEVLWPETSPDFPGEVWCVEVELSAKTAERTAGIMSQMLNRTGDYGEEANAAGPVRYARVVYVCAPAALGVVERARGLLPVDVRGRVEVRALPDGAVR